MSPRSQPMTAEELQRKLDADPEYQARMAERERERRAAGEEFLRAAEPLYRALADVGIDPAGFGTFVNDPEAVKLAYGELPPLLDSEAAVPVLIEWLPKIDHPRVKDAMASHLRTKAARPAAARPLLEELRRTPPEQDMLRWRLGEVLAYVAPREMFDELVEVAADPSFGRGRSRLVADVLWRVKTAEADELLIRLMEDDEVAGEAMYALRRRLGSEAAQPHIERLAKHPSPCVRTQADRALRRIRKSLRKR